MMSWSDPGWVGWTVMTISMLAFWVLIAVGFVALLGAGRGGRAPEEGNTAAQRLLDERFARGEIDEDDFHRRRELLSGRR